MKHIPKIHGVCKANKNNPCPVIILSYPIEIYTVHIVNKFVQYPIYVYMYKYTYSIYNT